MIENRMVIDELWNEPEEKTCKHCDYLKSLCQCEDE